VTGTFKANNPYNTFILLLYGLLLKLPMFLKPTKPLPQQTDGFLFRLLLQQLESAGKLAPSIYPVIAFLLLFAQAITFNQLVNSQRMMPKPHYLTGMCYLLLTSLFTEWHTLSAPLIINTLLIWVWAKMAGMHNVRTVTARLFNIGIVIGICTFFYFPSIAFSALVIMGLILTRPFRLAEWMVSLLGIVAPYYFLLSWVFLTDRWKGYKWPGFALSLPKFYDSGWALAAIIIVLFTTVVGLFHIRKNQMRQVVQTRKSWNLVLLYLFVAVFVPFINATRTFQYWILCAVPLSLMMAAAFYYPRSRWFAALLHWLMVAFVIALSYFVR
jgi:hypothetical protein